MSCAVCQKKADTRCANCNCTYYCSRECQKLDWKIHKKFCNSFDIKEEEEEKDGLKSTRRSIVAAKDLQCGSYILEENPLFQIARLPCTWEDTPGMSKKSLEKHHHYCSTCGSKFSIKKCDRCKWPVCVDAEKNCGKNKLHAENECEILASKKINYDSLEAFEDRRILLILRAQAVKEKNPEVWNELMKRAEEFSKAGQDSVENRMEISKLEEAMKKLKSSKLEDAMKKLKISNEDVKIYKKFFHLLNLTSIFYSSYDEMDSTMGIQDLRMGDFLYPLSNYFSNSCAPNCSYAIGSQPNFKIQVRAARAIKKGEELTISVDQLLVPLFEGTIERRNFIKERLGYLCKCKRCSDPTEFGTFFSGIVCQDCRPQGKNKNQLEDNIGYFLPFDPESKETEEGKGKDYSPLVQCNGCKTIRPHSFFKELLSRAEKELKKMEEKDVHKISTMKQVLQEFARIKLLLSKYSGKLLHPNHFLIHQAHNAFSKIYSPEMFQISSSSGEKIKCKEIWEDVVHFSKSQEALENKLLGGSLMFSQVRLQDIIATGLSRLAKIQTVAVAVDCVNLMDAMEKVKECIQLLTGAIYFHTNQMPTFSTRNFELTLLQTELRDDQEFLENLNKMHDSMSECMVKQQRRNF